MNPYVEVMRPFLEVIGQRPLIEVEAHLKMVCKLLLLLRWSRNNKCWWLLGLKIAPARASIYPKALSWPDTALALQKFIQKFLSILSSQFPRNVLFETTTLLCFRGGFVPQICSFFNIVQKAVDPPPFVLNIAEQTL